MRKVPLFILPLLLSLVPLQLRAQDPETTQKIILLSDTFLPASEFEFKEGRKLTVTVSGTYLIILQAAFEWKGRCTVRGGWIRRNGDEMLSEQKLFGWSTETEDEFQTIQTVWSGYLKRGDSVDFQVWHQAVVPVRLSARCETTWISLTLIKGEKVYVP